MEASEIKSEEVSASFEFNLEFQDKIAALSIRDENFVKRTEGLVSPSYFEADAVGVIVGLSQDYFAKYKSLPASKAVWAEIIRSASGVGKRIREDTRPDVIEALKRLYKTPMDSRDYILEEVSKFARHQAIQNAVSATITLADSKKFDEITEIFKKASQVGAHNDFVDVNYWEEIDKRTEHREKLESGEIKPNGISTGIPKLDKLLYHNGWGRKELSCIMAAAKRGKSVTLGDFAVKASLLGYNVIYVTLEVATDIIADRMDANVSSTKMSDLRSKLAEVKDGVKIKGASLKRGELRLAEFPSGSLSPSGLRRVIEFHKSQGRKFDLIVVDYGDIMRPDNVTSDSIENSKQVWLSLRAIASEEDAAVLTATQTNREGMKSETARSTDVAEDFNKVRIVDLMISLNATDEEIASGDARLFFAASRNQSGSFTISVKRDLEKMKAITAIISIS